MKKYLLIMLHRAAIGGALVFAAASPPGMHAQGSGAVRQSRLATWSLSTAPLLRIGGEGDSTTEFLRVVGASRMASGGIVVANAGTQELRVFSGNGQYLKRLSRAGDGPGELRYLASIARFGDTLFAMERGMGQRPLSTYSIGSGFRDRAALTASNAPQGVSALARLSDGSLFVVEGSFRAVDPREAPVWRDSIRLGILQLGNPGSVGWIGRFPAASWFSYQPRSIPGRLWMSRYTLGADLVSAVSGNCVWLGDSGTGQITTIAADGRIIAQNILPVPRRGFDDGSLEREKARLLASARDDDDRARYEGLFSRGRRPSRAPAFKRFIPGIRGEIGVELFTEEPGTSRSIIVLDSSGIAVAQFMTPAGLALYEMGADYVLGVQQDRDGVETVVMYRLERR